MGVPSRKIPIYRQRHRHQKPPRQNLGVEGFKEAGMATVKLVSHPIEQAVEGYHLVNGLNKIRKWLKGRGS